MAHGRRKTTTPKPKTIPEIIQKAFRLHIFSAKLRGEELTFKTIESYNAFVTQYKPH